MASLPPPRSFGSAVQSVRGEEPLLVAIEGPPGGGKTVSSLYLSEGIKRVRKGPAILIDTDGGRSKKYSPRRGEKADPARFLFDFLRYDMEPPFRSHDILACIRAQIAAHNPSSVIVDNMSVEHDEFLEWHDSEVKNFGGNEWAAWGPPKASRRVLIAGLLQIKIPMIFTFRAEEKTRQVGKRIETIGWMPIAPPSIIGAMDVVCLLPPKANGVPTWSSKLLGEDFILKLPNWAETLIRPGSLSADTGEALARWAAGDAPSPASGPIAGQTVPEPASAADRVVAAVKGRFPARNQSGERRQALLDCWGVHDPADLPGLSADAITLGLRAFEARKPLDEYLDGIDAARQLEQEANAGREPGEESARAVR